MNKLTSFTKSISLASAGLVSQQAGAAIVTVAGAGGGAITNLSVANGGFQGTDLSGILSNSFYLVRGTNPGAGNAPIGYLTFPTVADQVHVFAYRSTQNYSSVNPAAFVNSFVVTQFSALSTSFYLQAGADNFIPVQLQIAGVNGGNAIDAWLELSINFTPGAAGTLDIDVLSFTYNDADTDADGADVPKPIGGFTPTQFVPEPSSITLLALGAAGVLAQRRRRKVA